MMKKICKRPFEPVFCRWRFARGTCEPTARVSNRRIT
jgi:hypothetical protein